jgi:cyclase
MNRRDFLLKSGAAASFGLLAKGPLFAQNPAQATAPATTPIQPPPPVTAFQPVRRNVGLFTGQGGMIGWLANSDALVAVDTQFPSTAAIFLKDLPGRAGRTLEAVINTHHHGDHTGGNGVFRPATKTIVAHANVPALMRAAAARNPKPPAETELAPMLPDTTFPETWKQNFGDETISAKYFGPAHTKGDIVVLFEKANVAHLGDLLFNRLYPVIDRPGGANIRHWVTVLDQVVATYPKDVIFLFGHGNGNFPNTGGHGDVAAFRDYLSALIAHVEGEIKTGKTKEEILKLDNLPGFPDYHLPPGRSNRLPGNLTAAYEELTGAS